MSDPSVMFSADFESFTVRDDESGDTYSCPTESGHEIQEENGY